MALLAMLLASPAAAQGQGWEAMLPGLAPALRGCLSGQPRAMVVDAWPLDAGLVAARLLLPGGDRQDCVADPRTGAVARSAPVAAGDRRAGEGVRAFMLERRCVDAWRIDDAAGRELGWLAYPGCG